MGDDVDHLRGHPDFVPAMALWLTDSQIELFCEVIVGCITVIGRFGHFAVLGLIADYYSKNGLALFSLTYKVHVFAFTFTDWAYCSMFFVYASLCLSTVARFKSLHIILQHQGQKHSKR